MTATAFSVEAQNLATAIASLSGRTDAPLATELREALTRWPMPGWDCSARCPASRLPPLSYRRDRARVCCHQGLEKLTVSLNDSMRLQESSAASLANVQRLLALTAVLDSQLTQLDAHDALSNVEIEWQRCEISLRQHAMG